MVRPESVSLTASADPADGTVLNSVFYGTTAEYEIETSAGTLIACEASPDPDRLLDTGTHVRVELDVSRSYVLRKA